MPSWIGPWELILLLIVVLLVFGPKRLPEMGRSLGRGIREFKDSVTGQDKDEDEPEKVELPSPAATTTTVTETASQPEGERVSG